MQIFTPDGAQSYREGTNWAKGHLYALMGHLAHSFHIRALIATAEPENCPRESFSLPLKGHSQGRWIRGAGGGGGKGALAPQKIQHPNSAPFSKLKVYVKKSKTCPFFIEEKDIFPQYFCP